jgi:spoIIIJ-associated protein
MKRVIATGRTVEDAVTSALVKLGVTRDQAQVRVLQEPVRGLFGLFGGREARVEVSVRETPEQAAKAFLAELLQRMGVQAPEVRVRSGASARERMVDVSCSETDLPMVIGRRGITLDALQYLVNLVANRGQTEPVRFVLDAGDYRRRREEQVRKIAERAAERAVRTRRAVTLEPMPAAERKWVHLTLQARDDVRTWSEGVEPYRKVVVSPVDARSGSGPEPVRRGREEYRRGRAGGSFR